MRTELPTGVHTDAQRLQPGCRRARFDWHGALICIAMQQRQYKSAMIRPSDAGVVTCSFDVAVPSGLSKPSMCRSVSTPTSSSGEVS